MNKITLSILGSFLFFTGIAQTFSGAELDNFSGINSLVYNPSNVVDSRFKSDINIFTLNSTIASDFFGIGFSTLIGNPDGFDFEEDATTFPSQANNIFLNVDILGPSFMFNLSPKHAIGITTRARGYLNLNRVNGELFETIQNNEAVTKDFNIDMENFNGTTHSWNEYGLTYGFVLLDSGTSFLKAGVTLKYLQGNGAVFFTSNKLSGSYDDISETLTADGDLTYGQTLQDEDGDTKFEFGSGSSGFAVDAGLIYEYRPDLGDQKMDPNALKGHNKYRLKLGLSLQDMGSLSYDDVSVENYIVTGTVAAEDFEDDFEQALEDNYSNTSTVQTVDLELPTAIRYLIDYRIDRNLYIGASGVYSLNDDSTPLSNRRLNYTSIAPRYESRLFSLHTNLTMMEYTDFIWGAGFRFGPLTVGSGSIISNLISDDSRAADVYVGLKIPLLQKRKTRDFKAEENIEEEEEDIFDIEQ